MKTLLADFRRFVMKGNLLEVAVAFIIGLYFKDVIDVFTNGIVLAFVAAIFGEANFSDITIGIGDAELLVGAFINVVVNFLIVAFILFLIVKAYDQYRARRGQADEDVLSDEVRLLTEIRDTLRSGSA